MTEMESRPWSRRYALARSTTWAFLPRRKSDRMSVSTSVRVIARAPDVGRPLLLEKRNERVEIGFGLVGPDELGRTHHRRPYFCRNLVNDLFDNAQPFGRRECPKLL